MNGQLRAALDMPGAEAGTDARARLAAAVEAAAMLPGLDAAALAMLRDKLAGHVFNLVFAGEFKRGKSSTINALLGAEVLPTGVLPLTSIVTVLRHAPVPAVEVRFEDGHAETVGLGQLAAYVTERGNPKNAKRVGEVEVGYPAPWLSGGFRLVDTPGIGSAYGHNTEVTRAYLPQADAVVFVASVEQPVSQSELEFLADIRAYAGRVFCLLNKADHLSPAELAESVAFSSEVLRTALGIDVPVFPVSARRALAARAAGVSDVSAGDGFAAFDAALCRFFAQDSETVWLGSVQRHLARLLAECRLAVELEHKAIDTPMETLATSLAAFAAKKRDAAQARSDVEALLQADTRKLVEERIDPDLDTFKRELAGRLDRAVPGWLEAANAQRGVPCRTALEQRIVAEVRAAFDAWRPREDEAVGAAFDRVCARFQQRIQELVDELRRYSAGLFSLHYETQSVEPFRAARSRFHYKFWRDEDSLGMTMAAFGGLVPGALGRALLLKRARKRVADLVDTQSGRVHYDMVQRVERAMQAARRDMLARFDATIASIETAIDQGQAMKARGEGAASARQGELAVELARIDAIVARVQLGLHLPERAS